MPLHPAQFPLKTLLSECEFQRTRAGGPGGQHRNKVETAIVVKHLPSGVKAQASERRSQHGNREVAIFRLRLNLAVEVRVDAVNASPSELWLSRRSQGLIRINARHEDFPAILAEALDFLYSHDLDVGVTAEKLGISRSQLQKLIRSAPAAWQKLNSDRTKIGLKPLR